MVVHPFLLFSYWEVTPESVEEACRTMGAEMDGARAVLRMYDISLINFDGTNAHQVFDIEVGLEGRGWYIPVWTAEKSYCADLGFLARTGRFHSIVRSNIIHTPRAAASHRTDEQWMRVTFARRRKPDRGRSLEFVAAPERNRVTADQRRAQEQSRRQREQQSAAAVAAYLKGSPSSRPGQR
jgi:hypothetical protein